VKKLTFCDVAIHYPWCTLLYEAGSTRLAKHVNVANLQPANFCTANHTAIRHLLMHVGMAYIPRLFALDDFDVVQVRPLRLSPTGIEFYETYFQHGLAELRLRNGLNVGKRVHVSAEAGAPGYEPEYYKPNNSALLMNGGGKDTVVAAELLREIGLPFVWLTLGITPAMKRIVRLSGNPHALTLKVGGSVQTISANSQYRGHKPFSSLLAFLGLLAAFVQRHRYIVVANEYSSNFGNVMAGGIEVNHQYAKSHQFEKRFAAYVNAEILPEVSYFSILRPLYEIQVAKLFAEHPRYFQSFRSCNLGHSADYWCLKCPKCAFILLALTPHLDKCQLRNIFGLNAFALPRIRRLIARLCGPNKPFECVGTRAESMVALSMSYKRYPNDRFIARLYDAHCGGVDINALEQQHMGSIDRPHTIPQELAGPVMAYFADRLECEWPAARSGHQYARGA
jgi:UDP-N-acetyl-alpha-D-muramoyl-L-alanyl-L-glutamate epimerase